MNKISRRDFLKGIAILGGSALYGGVYFVYNKFVQPTVGAIVELTPEAFLPLVTKSESTNTPTSTPTATNTPTSTPTATNTPTSTPTATNTPTATPTGTSTSPSRPKVIHVMNSTATDWDFGDDWYGDHVNQNVVNDMTDVGLMQLTNTVSRAEAWQSLLPNYQTGQRVAIKVNLNNCLVDGCMSNVIDALIEPVNAVIRGLLEREVTASDIFVYDVTHAWHDGRIPPRFVSGCDYPGVNFAAYVGATDPFSATEKIHFNTPLSSPTIMDLSIGNVLVNAHYLINIPIVKIHPFTGVSLGFKNHFGSFDRCDYAHVYTPGCPTDVHTCYYDANYSPLIDIYSNAHIKNKTILTVGDCLFGAWSDPTWKPLPWTTFRDNAPNSLFFAVDPVAIECVMTDILNAETPVIAETYDYLQLANSAGLGVYERGNPWGAGYQQIDYTRIDTGV